jgi:hypothetical protein
MIRFAERKVNPDAIKNRVSFLNVICVTCFFLSIFLFVFTCVYSLTPEKHIFISAETVLIGLIFQAALFLIGVSFYIYTDKLKIVFKIDLYKPQKKNQTRSQQIRTYRKHFKRRLVNFIIFEFFLIAFFVSSLTVTRAIGQHTLFINDSLNGELVFLIYTIVSLIALAIDIMYVNYLIQLSSKIFRKKTRPNPINFDNYDYD